ncbi:hypothetical protein RVR_4412 [Actinacidiphila reveromycinica]|uniref:Lipoprotein n=1 Tax=Actinacidiphila reveromycinica TaxID=659352 RepID=A0A7U3UTE7_9ACTN|nr:hypothetical protein [Streptomyces sp. SN-593]BBA98281.1 hypothetical protein RVR_4412 [Streptomyces sp. SN-593]
MTGRQLVIGGVATLFVLLLLVLAGCMKVAGDDDCDDDWFALAAVEKPSPPRPPAQRAPSLEKKPTTPKQPVTKIPAPRSPSTWKAGPAKGHGTTHHHGHDDLCD